MPGCFPDLVLKCSWSLTEQDRVYLLLFAFTEHQQCSLDNRFLLSHWHSGVPVQLFDVRNRISQRISELFRHVLRSVIAHDHSRYANSIAVLLQMFNHACCGCWVHSVNFPEVACVVFFFFFLWLAHHSMLATCLWLEYCRAWFSELSFSRIS